MPKQAEENGWGSQKDFGVGFIHIMATLHSSPSSYLKVFFQSCCLKSLLQRELSLCNQARLTSSS